MDRSVQDTIAQIYGGKYVDEEEVEIDYSDPFFAPAKAANEKWGEQAEKTFGKGKAADEMDITIDQ
jgi:hypothetical protein